MKEFYTQEEAFHLYKTGCYFLSLIHAVESYAKEKLSKTIETDIIRFYRFCIEQKWIDYECTVLDPAKIVSYMLKGGYRILARKTDLSYVPKDNEIEITRYERAMTGITYSHFVETRNGEIIFDPLCSSNTVVFGKRVSKRIITID